LNATSEITGSLQRSVTNITEYLRLKEANKTLAAENARLRSQLLSAYHITDTAHFSKTDTTNKQQYHYISTRVISNSVSNRNNYIMLDKGRKDGIKPDMAVISPDGVVGIVSKVSENFSWVISLLHKQTKISAKISKNGFVGTVTWDGLSYANGKLQDIPANVQIAKGDTVVTSGYSHVFPPNMLIGTIKDFSVDKGYNFYEITLKFSQNYNKLSYVYVVTDFLRDEKIYLERFKVDE
ncbi:MAG: rod shape-determining protein MreC, partial [Bacteroidetes bacterium]|nr:rod shape-determining protein MreC [Bacteroidota bacterium]